MAQEPQAVPLEAEAAPLEAEAVSLETEAAEVGSSARGRKGLRLGEKRERCHCGDGRPACLGHLVCAQVLRNLRGERIWLPSSLQFLPAQDQQRLRGETDSVFHPRA